MLLLFTLSVVALNTGIVWWLFWITFKEDWEEKAYNTGFEEGYAIALAEHGITVDDKDGEPIVTVKSIHPLDEVAEMDTIAVPEHNPTEEILPPDPGIVIPLQDDKAGHE